MPARIRRTAATPVVLSPLPSRTPLNTLQVQLTGSAYSRCVRTSLPLVIPITSLSQSSQKKRQYALKHSNKP